MLEAEELSLKIDTNRKFYVKKPENQEFIYTEYDLPYGMKKEEKASWLVNKYYEILNRIQSSSNTSNEEGGEKEDGMEE